VIAKRSPSGDPHHRTSITNVRSKGTSVNVISSSRSSRWCALALAAAVFASSLAPLVASTTTHASGGALWFANGEGQITVGPNSAIYIDGAMTYDAACADAYEGAITDFVYPATDVYIVPTGTAGMGSHLQDVGGDSPNTIVATSSGPFFDELIAVTTPSGSLAAGVYDVVYDTCQDKLLWTNDRVFSQVITVEIPDGELPPVDPSIAQLKEKARQSYSTWLQYHLTMKALFNVENAAAIAECILIPTPQCLAEIIGGLFGISKDPQSSLASLLQDQTLALVMNVAKNYGAIWQDPPDADYQQLPVIDAADVTELPPSGSPVPDALDALAQPLADEAALGEALVHAMERYQGAQAAGDEEWALIQARSIRDLSRGLADQLSSSAAAQDLRDALAADIDDMAANAAHAAAVHARIRKSGFDVDERRALANLGLDAAAISDLENSLVDQGQVLVPTGPQLLAQLDDALTARSEMIAGLHASAAGWNDLATTLEATVSSPIPVAAAGGPYTASGSSAQLDASTSTTPTGSAIVSYEWDFDGDGAFDDATGATPTLPVQDDTVVAVRVSNDAGYGAVDVAVVSAAPQAGPTINMASPQEAAVATVGQATTFEVSATGVAGSDVTYEWRLNGGDVVGTGPTFVYTPAAAEVGHRVLGVIVTSAGRSVSHAWPVSTLAVDADGDGWTATSDCDDSRADVHPGGFERLTNERDDDCDTSTPDAPLGGLTGEVWSWGFFSGLGTGSGQNSSVPVHVTTLPDDVRAIESGDRSGYALLTDGTVRAWGLNGTGQLGIGTYTTALTPVTVQNVGGGGALGNVVDVSSDPGRALALLADGSVRAWGDNTNRSLGDGSAVTYRTTPVIVLDESGAPLADVAQVDTSSNTSYAVMADGTVKVFGLDRCVGSATGIIRPVATTNGLFGDQVVQLESGINAAAITLNADGSVWTCVGYTPQLGRPVTTLDQAFTPGQVTGFGPGSGAIDVAMGHETALILTEDGTVWMWGHNLNHSLDVLGLPGGATQLTPAPVPLPPGPPVIDIEMDGAATMFATRADGSVIVWGANIYDGGGVGYDDYAIVGTPTIDLDGGQAVSVKNSMWHGLALVQPSQPGVEPVLPIQWIDVSADDTEIGEAAGGAVTVRLSEAANVDVTVEYDFNGVDGSAVVPAGTTSVAVPVAVVDDTVDEDDEDLAFNITSASHGASIADHTAIVTVVDDDAPPDVSAADVTLTEGDTSLTDVTVTLTLSSPSGRDIVIDYATADGTAVAAGSPGDYQAASGSVLVPAGSTSSVVHLAVVGDSAVESAETFTLQLIAADHATIGDGTAVVSIGDDEPLVLAVTSPTVTEGDAGTTDAAFMVSVTTPPTSETVTVPWALSAGTAELGSDVTAASGELTLSAASPSALVVAGVVGDTAAEDLSTETFRLVVGNAVSSGGRQILVADTPVGTIVDDDGNTPVIVVDAGADVGGSEGAATAIAGSVDGVDLAGGAATAEWSVNDNRCVVADPTALATSVTCPDETTATLTLTVDDGAGSTASDTATLTIANVAPTVTISAPVDGSAVAVGAPVGVVAAISDPGTTDTTTCSIDWGDGSPSTMCDATHIFGSPGVFGIVITASDDDGGDSTASVGIVVNPIQEPAPGYDFDGFYVPVDNAPIVNVVKAGSTVPVKFGLGGDHGLDIFAAGFPISVSQTCDGQVGDALEETALPGSSTLTYDPGTGHYHYNWKTDKAWAGTCRRLVLQFVDGTQATAEFRFR
jgi:alpha-tubulin suppressor-like RCC1 family protein